MSLSAQIAKLEKKLETARAKLTKEHGKRVLHLAKQEGHRTVDEFIKALSAFASPVMKGKLSGNKPAKASTPAKAAAPVTKKRTRATIDDAKRAAIVADLKTGKMTAAKLAAKHGVSVPSINNIKKAAGLIGK